MRYCGNYIEPFGGGRSHTCAENDTQCVWCQLADLQEAAQAAVDHERDFWDRNGDDENPEPTWLKELEAVLG